MQTTHPNQIDPSLVEVNPSCKARKQQLAVMALEFRTEVESKSMLHV
jgi:hypothetical protein